MALQQENKSRDPRRPFRVRENARTYAAYVREYLYEYLARQRGKYSKEFNRYKVDCPRVCCNKGYVTKFHKTLMRTLSILLNSRHMKHLFTHK